MLGATVALLFLVVFYIIVGLSRSLGFITKQEAEDLKSKAHNMKAEE